MTPPRILIRGARTWDPERKSWTPVTLVVASDRIVERYFEDRAPETPCTHEIDARDLWLLPGLVDLHVHLRDPGLTYKEEIATGTRAAVAGGITTVVAMANTQPVNDTPEVTRYVLERTAATGWCRVLPVGAATLGLAGEELAPYHRLKAAGCVAISDDGNTVPTAGVMRRVLEYAASVDLPVLPHCEDRTLRAGGVMNAGPAAAALGLPGNPREAEEIALARDLALARMTGARLHVQHVTIAEGVELIRRAKAAGVRVTAEVCPHHLFLTDEEVAVLGTCAKMAPPLRSERDKVALRRALAEGVLDILATDHAPHAPFEKDRPFEEAPDGIIGLETLLPLSLRLIEEGTLDHGRWYETVIRGPRRILGLPTEDLLAPGAPADLVLIDPERAWTYQAAEGQSRSRNTPFDGWRFRGRAVLTLVAGVARWDLDGRAADADLFERPGFASEDP